MDTETTETFATDWEGGTVNHRNRHSFRAGDLVGTLLGEICNDGMSELENEIELNLIFLDDALHYQGCCFTAPRATSD